MPVSKKAITLKPFLSQILAFEKPIKYYKWEFWALTVLDSKVLTWNCTVLSSFIAFKSCFLIAGAETSNLATVKFIPRSSIRLVIALALSDFFNTLTICRYFFFLIGFFGLLVSASGIAVFWEKLGVKAGVSIEASIEISFTGFYLPNLIFFDIA